MTQKPNYDRLMEEEIASLGNSTPTLLLHSCCGPCSSAVLERLVPHFRVTLLYYNPNIEPEVEYLHRLSEQTRLITLLNQALPESRQIAILSVPYDHESFAAFAPALADEPEGGRRCLACFALRLGETARQAKAHGFDYFTTTLSVSPHKNVESLHRAGQEAARAFGVRYLPADFKKRNGYLRSLRLSAEYSLYRQDYCGCLYSKNPENHGHSDDTEGRS